MEKWLMTSFGKAVIASVKCVMAGHMPGAVLLLGPFSALARIDPRPAKGRA